MVAFHFIIWYGDTTGTYRIYVKQGRHIKQIKIGQCWRFY